MADVDETTRAVCCEHGFRMAQPARCPAGCVDATHTRFGDAVELDVWTVRATVTIEVQVSAQTAGDATHSALGRLRQRNTVVDVEATHSWRGVRRD